MKRHRNRERSGRRARVPDRRGAAGISMVIVLVTAQLLVVATVVSGSRDQDQLVRRVDTARAFYAAEAGVNMAVREVMKGTDDDGDGGIGTVSADGNANDDPLFITGRVSVGKSMGGGTTSLVASGRSGLARRAVGATVNGNIGGVAQTVVAAFAHAGSSTPRYSAWNGTSWGTVKNMPATSGEAKWIRLKLSPTRNETTFIQEDLNKHVDVSFFDGTSWKTMTMLSSDTGGTNDRPEDIAYEQTSGTALCVYWKGSQSKFGYRTYDGTTFTSELLVSNPFSTECDFLTLCPRPDSDDIVMLAADGNAGGPLVASFWNGSSFASWTTIVAALETNNEECYAMAYEAQTKRGLLVYTESGAAATRYRTLTGSAWSAQLSMPALGGVGKWLRLSADPTTDAIIFGALDANNDLTLNAWNGSAWGAGTVAETSVPGYAGRQFDIMFERGTGHAIAVYAEGTVQTPRYRTWNGSSWSSEMSMPTLGAAVNLVYLARGLSNGEVVSAISDTSGRLHLNRWNGTAWSTDTIIETTLGGWTYYTSFAVPEPTPQPHPRMLTWVETAP